MEQRVYFAASAVILLACGISARAPHPGFSEPESVGLRAVQQKEGWLITEGEKRVLFYQRTPKSLDGKYTRADYIHPLCDLDGNVLTEDFPADHLHQRGIYWAWHQVNAGGKRVGDSWELKDFSYDVADVTISSPDPQSIALKALVFWKSPNWLDAAGEQTPFVRETSIITAYRASPELRKIDFHIRLVALAGGVSIGGSEDEKGYGGFSVRLRLPGGVRFTGRDGNVAPKVTAVAAGPWIDVSGRFGADSRVSGVAILSHPSLPVFPPTWILREKESMQNAVYPGRTPVPLVPGKPLDLRYRLVIHRGDARQAGIDRLQSAYEKEEIK